MQLEYRQLSGDEITQGLKDLKEWDVEGEKLAKSFEFSSYKEGVTFATRVADVADEMDHHPDLEIGYKKVRISMNTHSVGGLSPYDLELARRIDGIQA
ncbi:MAG: 4a-hydroxytetrahydrobiopterin dehydratase [Fimbriimonas sp.]